MFIVETNAAQNTRHTHELHWRSGEQLTFCSDFSTQEYYICTQWKTHGLKNRVSKWERETKCVRRDRGRKKGRIIERDSVSEREKRLCVCVCVREKERESGRELTKCRGKLHARILTKKNCENSCCLDKTSSIDWDAGLMGYNSRERNLIPSNSRF